MTTATANEITIKALPKQMQFLKSTAREVLYSGAYGAGKTYALCLKAALHASVPGAAYGLCRKHNVTLKKSTIKTLLRGVGDVPPILPPGSYVHYKHDQRIEIKGGGHIEYFGLDDPEKIGSFEFTSIGVDEAVELTSEDWRQLRGRLRGGVKGLMRQLSGACNPGPPSHFLAERFGLSSQYKCAPECEVIQTKSHDNRFLPDDYLSDLNTFTGLAYKRYVLGLWVGSEGLVYDNWDRDKHVVYRHRSEFDRFVVGVDEGYTNPTSMHVWGVDGDGRMHALHEFYKTKQLHEDIIKHCEWINAEYKPDVWIVDSASAKLIAGLKNIGLNALKARKDVLDGIQRVQGRLADPGDGRPRLTVDPSCENIIREYETYEWKPNKDEPVKAHDHAMDEARYVATYLDDGIINDIPVGVIGNDGERSVYDDPAYDDRNWTEL